MTDQVERIKNRYAHCDACGHHKYGLCLKCGCVLALKIRLENTKCPIGKW